MAAGPGVDTVDGSHRPRVATVALLAAILGVAVLWRRSRHDPDRSRAAPAGPGLVLITDGPDGPMVQGLDGTTGDTVWTYRRVGARILRLDASPDGRTVYVDSTMEGSWSSDFRVQAIDARTGKLRG